jgi:hypothetical protein
LTVIIGLLYLQLTDHANVPWAVDIIIFMQGFPETWKLFQVFLQGKNIEKGCIVSNVGVNGDLERMWKEAVMA